jgi:HAD superfamily hydrolase (TIGR01484 family)
MRYVCLICDYDGTIAQDGCVAKSTLAALEKVRSSGRKLVLATGRQLDDLLKVFPEAGLFDRIVAENGAVLYRPASKEQIALADPPPREFVDELVRRGVQPLSVGRCVVATWHPNESIILDAIRTMSLELQIIFNKNAVMILPSGVNKGTGLQVALQELKLSPHNSVGIGDGENDHAFLGFCESSIAVENAVPALKERADWVTQHSHGAGVEEAIELLLQNDLQSLAPRLSRHDILLGRKGNDEQYSLPAYGVSWLVAGPSGSGKSTVISAVVERLAESKYQICLFDPEGDYEEMEQLITVGGPQRVPSEVEILEILNNPSRSLSVNLLGVPLADRPSFFQSALTRVQELRFKTGRPHWIVVDEAHHVLPAELGTADGTVAKELTNLFLVTVHPDLVSPAVLSSVGGIIAVGSDPHSVFKLFNKAARKNLQVGTLGQGQAAGSVVAWRFGDSAGPCSVEVQPAKGQRKRHLRKYASGELGEDKSFYFRGKDGKLNLRAQNMNLFAQLAEGVDDETWTFHLCHGDYSRWLREATKDKEIAEAVERIEKDGNLSFAESRRQIIDAIRKHYTAAA